MDVIGYYNKYASKIFEDTVFLEKSEERQVFLKYLEEGDTILDLGCGSGRDSLAFYEEGYDVTLLDASEEMCKLAEIHTGLEVLMLEYKDMDFHEVFDGIWANEAIIHESDEDLAMVLDRIEKALCKKGILYLSFYEGDFEGGRGVQYYCHYREDEMMALIKKVGDFSVLKAWKTEMLYGKKQNSLIHMIVRKES